tara:strand:- start:10051 stop:10224 length:174 start_codon:yes stop_codon:yes gene_type:complete
MPMVGDKKFSYTDDGKRKAKQYANETSKIMHVGYRKGGKPLKVDSPTGKKCVFGLKK